MAEADSYAKYKHIKTEQNRANPSKFYTHFLYKALIVSIFLVLLPLFPSQAPDFIHQNILTRSWELLHLLFVGIAVSYGLFSHRNDEIEKENHNHTKFDNAQTYVSRFLQVSSVFDDDGENLSASDENKVQTWSHQYYRNEPVVVVAKDHSALDSQEQRGTGAGATPRIGDKPLLLPVRSLKSRVADSDNVESSCKEANVKSSYSISGSSSSSGSRRFSSNSIKTRSVESGGFDQNVNLGEKINENVVLPSPIPWRSRSGRMEMKEEVDTMPPPMEESEFNKPESRSLWPQMPRPCRPNSTSSSPKLSSSPPSLSSPKKLSPLPSLSSESQVKNPEDSVRKKSFYRPPPPPPPPPPPMMHKSSSMKLGSSWDSVQRNPSMSRVNPTGRPVRRFKSVEKSLTGTKDREFEDGFNGKSERSVTFDQTPFKAEQLSRDSVAFMAKPTFMEFPQQDKQEFVDKVVVETEDDSEIEDEEEDDELGEGPFVSSIIERSPNNEEGGSSSMSDGGPDVDKKADEFIAKFREQIRLQRIESIKRSSAQISRNSTR